jgi:hypothetical protein
LFQILWDFDIIFWVDLNGFVRINQLCTDGPDRD